MILLPAIPLLVIVTALVGLGFIVISRSSSEGITGWLIGTLGRAATLGLLLIPGAVQLTRYVSNHVGKAVSNATILTVHWFAGLVRWAEAFGAMALSWPTELFRAVNWIVYHEVPRIVRALAHGVTVVAGYSVKRLGALERAIVNMERFLTKYARKVAVAAVTVALFPWLPFLHWLRTHVATLAHAIPKAIPWHYPRDWTHTLKRLRKLERSLTKPAILAAVAVAIGAAAVKLFRCPQFLRAGSRACSLDKSLFESLLADTLAIASLMSVVEFAHELRAVEDEALKIMGSLVREWPT